MGNQRIVIEPIADEPNVYRLYLGTKRIGLLRERFALGHRWEHVYDGGLGYVDSLNAAVSALLRKEGERHG